MKRISSRLGQGLAAAGVGDTDTFARASQRAGSFGLFIRSIIDRIRSAAAAA